MSFTQELKELIERHARQQPWSHEKFSEMHGAICDAREQFCDNYDPFTSRQHEAFERNGYDQWSENYQPMTLDLPGPNRWPARFKRLMRQPSHKS